MPVVDPMGRSVERTGAIIVGAGPAGLAVAACLGARGLPYVVLERSGAVGDSWRRHYDRLHLHTHKRNSALPHGPWPASAPAYPSRDAVVAYLEAYSAALTSPPRLRQAVRRAWPEDGSWRAETERGTYEAKHLVVATGLNDVPRLPSWPGLDGFPGTVLHSSEYVNGAPFGRRPVLVVGFGNSGGEIAVDLTEHGARPTLAVRGPVNVVPRRLLGRPIEEVARWLERLPGPLADTLGQAARRLRFGDVERYGLRLAPYSPTRQVAERARIPLIDVGTIDLIRRGVVRIRPRVERVDGADVVFAGGRREAFDAIVLATGYNAGFPEFLLPARDLDTRLPLQLPSAEGLHFCGFTVTAGGTLSRIALEAEAVAARIAGSDPGLGDQPPSSAAGLNTGIVP